MISASRTSCKAQIQYITADKAHRARCVHEIESVDRWYIVDGTAGLVPASAIGRKRLGETA